jgi:hypothetical protein
MDRSLLWICAALCPRAVSLPITWMIALGIVTVLADVAPAFESAFVTPSAWTRGAVRSTYQEWDVFGSPIGDPPNLPDVGVFNPNAPLGEGLNVADATQAAFITSDGNIYTFQSAIDVQATVPNYGLGAWYHTIVIAQTQTIGTELSYSDLTINGVHANSTIEISRVPYPVQFTPETPYVVGHSTVWRLPGNEFNYTFDFPASAASSSFDRVAIDTFTVLTGDVTGDSLVDIQDITKIANNWLQPSPAADANGDGIVDIQDITLVANNWLHSAANAPPAEPPAQTLVVPEPATWALLLTGAASLGLMVGRRRVQGLAA